MPAANTWLAASLQRVGFADKKIILVVRLSRKCHSI
jgi:hypothetical protein